MRRTPLAVLALAASVLAASGCGGSTKASSQAASTTVAGSPAGATATQTAPSGPLTRAQLIEKGEAICYRLNVKRSSTRISQPGDYERFVPVLAATELAAATEMGNLTPPPALAGEWREMIAGAHAIGEVTGHFPHYSEASNNKLAHRYDVILSHAVEQLTGAARRAGFKECARFV